MLGLVPAPELNRSGLDWFNVSRPLSLSDLRRRLVILDFWTASCVNCLHIQPTLRQLQDCYGDNIAIIGVNSPKYPAEQDPDSLVNALARFDILHPVVHDPQLELWHEYGIHAWPTLVFIDPEGRILGDLTGEPVPDRLIAGIGAMLRAWRGAGGAAPPLPLPLQLCPKSSGRFRFPTKIKPAGRVHSQKLWAISDSGHHQVVLCDDRGCEIRRFGCGKPGFLDLAGENAAFNSPQGLCSDGGSIFVADTGNHAIRRIELRTGDVRTLAGTGERGSLLEGKSNARDTCLASVWDIECWGRRLLFANAGTHQLGCLDLVAGEISTLAGRGYEDLVDGAACEAHLAQPTGLALDTQGGMLYFVDSETSSVRVVDLGAGVVRTLVGAGLFEFGRRNGDFGQARLQHCRGIAWRNGSLLVADTYNSTLRILDLGTRHVTELTGECIWGNGVRLNGGQPAGVATDGTQRVLLCDTNHHRIIELTSDGSTPARIWAA